MEKSIKYLFGITAFATLSILAYGVFLDPVFDERDGLRPREGISIGHNEAIRMDKIDFYIINTRETDFIELRYNPVYLDQSLIGKVGVYFPYKVEMISNMTGWEKAFVDAGTAFMKKYACNGTESCRINYDEQLGFKLEPENSKFDKKTRFKHGIKVEFDSSKPPGADNFFRDDNLRNDPLKFSYDDSTTRQVSIIIPREADNIHLIPMGEPDVFYNRGVDYGNNRIFWELYKNDHAFFLDYEMPNERQNFESSKLLITMSGIVLGIIIGSTGIAVTLSSKKAT